MTKYNTGNPVGSSDPRDLYDNAENLDEFSNSGELRYDDRLGVSRRTLAGINQIAAGYNPRGDFVTGTDYNVNDLYIATAGTYVGSVIQVIQDHTSTTTDSDIASGYVTLHQPHNYVASVDTIADLRNLEPLFDGQQIELLGHTVAGIGGGVFYADFSDTTSPDNNGAVIVTPGGKRWKRKRSDGFFEAEWFGLYDGASQAVCSDAVQAIIDTVESDSRYNVDNQKTGYGCTIFFPSGRFPLSGIRVSKFNFIFEGTGHGTYLVNEAATGKMIDCRETSSSTISGILFRDMSIRNRVSRSDGAGPIIDMFNPVRSGFVNVIFESSEFNSGSRVALPGDMLRTTSPFEFIMQDVFMFGFSVGWEIVSSSQSDSMECINFITSQCGIGVIGFAGAGGSGNNNFKMSGKFIGSQGGQYAVTGQDAYARTTVASTSGNTLTVADATNMLVGRAVVAGTDNTIEWAIIKSISGNVLTLDRPVTKAAGTRVLSGRIGMILCEMRNPSFEGLQLEGLDIGLLSITGSREISVDAVSISSCAKPFYAASLFRRFNITNGTCGTAGTLRNGVTWKLLTLDEQISSDANKIYMDAVIGEGSGYFDGTLDSLVDNLSTHEPYINIDSRFEGDSHIGDNERNAVTFKNRSYLGFDRDANNFNRIRWQSAGIDSWFLDSSGATNPDLRFRRATEALTSLTLFGFNGDVSIGDGSWDGPLFRIGDTRFWINGTQVRAKQGTPTSATDGFLVVDLL